MGTEECQTVAQLSLLKTSVHILNLPQISWAWH